MNLIWGLILGAITGFIASKLMIMMADMFAVTVVEDICDTLTEKISDL